MSEKIKPLKINYTVVYILRVYVLRALRLHRNEGGVSVESAPTFHRNEGGGTEGMRQGKGGIKKWRSAPNDVAG